MPKITPNLWFTDQAEEAAKFYVSLFGEGSRVGRITRYTAAPSKVAGRPEGSVLTVEFELRGQAFLALNGGTDLPFTEAVSFAVDCADQAEVDRFWTALTADGGAEGQCGWCRDRYGLSWQVVPRALDRLLSDPDLERAERATEAMMKMKKLDVAALERAADGR